MTGILPDEIIHRPKQDSAQPVREWLRDELYSPAIAGVMRSRLREENLLDYDHVSGCSGAPRGRA